MTQGDLLSINSVAAKLGLSVHQLRRWELMFGLEIKRGRGQQRQYRPEDLSVLERIKELVEQGWPTSQIRPQLEAEGLVTPKLIGLPPPPGNPEVLMEALIGFRNFTERRFIEISRQIDELRQLLISITLKQELESEPSSPWQPLQREFSPEPKHMPAQEISIGPEINIGTPVDFSMPAQTPSRPAAPTPPPQPPQRPVEPLTSPYMYRASEMSGPAQPVTAPTPGASPFAPSAPGFEDELTEDELLDQLEDELDDELDEDLAALEEEVQPAAVAPLPPPAAIETTSEIAVQPVSVQVESYPPPQPVVEAPPAYQAPEPAAVPPPPPPTSPFSSSTASGSWSGPSQAPSTSAAPESPFRSAEPAEPPAPPPSPFTAPETAPAYHEEQAPPPPPAPYEPEPEPAPEPAYEAPPPPPPPPPPVVEEPVAREVIEPPPPPPPSPFSAPAEAPPPPPVPTPPVSPFTPTPTASPFASAPPSPFTESAPSAAPAPPAPPAMPVAPPPPPPPAQPAPPAASAQASRAPMLGEITDQNYLTILGRALDLVGWSDEQADAFSSQRFGVPHWDELGRSQAEVLIDHLINELQNQMDRE